jgi:hypothetical protein
VLQLRKHSVSCALTPVRQPVNAVVAAMAAQGAEQSLVGYQTPVVAGVSGQVTAPQQDG